MSENKNILEVIFNCVECCYNRVFWAKCYTNMSKELIVGYWIIKCFYILKLLALHYFIIKTQSSNNRIWILDVNLNSYKVELCRGDNGRYLFSTILMRIVLKNREKKLILSIYWMVWQYYYYVYSRKTDNTRYITKRIYLKILFENLTKLIYNVLFFCYRYINLFPEFFRS